MTLKKSAVNIRYEFITNNVDASTSAYDDRAHHQAPSHVFWMKRCYLGNDATLETAHSNPQQKITINWRVFECKSRCSTGADYVEVLDIALGLMLHCVHKQAIKGRTHSATPPHDRQNDDHKHYVRKNPKTSKNNHKIDMHKVHHNSELC